jgi:hypothetical protein
MLLIIVFCAGLLAGVYIHLSYAASMPRIPDPITGRVIRITVNHGTVVYVTRQEFERAEWVFGTGAYLTFAAGLLLAFVSVYWGTGRSP